jgi:hypothetical protein
MQNPGSLTWPKQTADGLARAARRFPSPPVPPAVRQAQLDYYQEKNAALAQSRAEAQTRRVDKHNPLETLEDAMLADLMFGGHRQTASTAATRGHPNAGLTERIPLTILARPNTGPIDLPPQSQ